MQKSDSVSAIIRLKLWYNTLNFHAFREHYTYFANRRSLISIFSRLGDHTSIHFSKCLKINTFEIRI